jgi:hypothetical protein
MKVIYHGDRADIIDDTGEGATIQYRDGGEVRYVLWSDPRLIVDPTDDEWLQLAPDWATLRQRYDAIIDRARAER